MTLRVDQDDTVARRFYDAPETVLCLVWCGGIKSRPEVAKNHSIWAKPWPSAIENPAILTVPSSQTVLHREGMAFFKGVNVDFKTAVEVFAVNAFCPAVAKFLFQGAASKVEPTFIEKGAEFVRARHPDHHRRCICHSAKTSLTFPQRLLRLLLRGYIHPDANKPGGSGRPGLDAVTPRANPAHGPIR